MKKGYSIALCVLTLAVGSLAALVEQDGHAPLYDDDDDDRELRVIVFKDGDKDEAKLALTTYDLSIAGFANGSDHWFAFPGHEERIPRSTPLPFGNSYRDLIGGLANLPSLPLGRAPMRNAISVLSISGDPAATAAADDDEARLKRALATMAVVTSEAMRLAPIKETVLEGWESGDANVSIGHLPLIEHYDTICFEMLRAHKNGGAWDGPFTELLRERANIHGVEDAAAVVSVIANRTMQQVLMAHARRA